jgi:hypothetical protein
MIFALIILTTLFSTPDFLGKYSGENTYYETTNKLELLPDSTYRLDITMGTTSGPYVSQGKGKWELKNNDLYLYHGKSKDSKNVNPIYWIYSIEKGELRFKKVDIEVPEDEKKYYINDHRNAGMSGVPYLFTKLKE